MTTTRWSDRLDRRLAAEHRLRDGFAWLVGAGLGYAVVIVVLARGGDRRRR
jgi:hypothetical protein